jgi:hypothetical protein
MLTHRADQEYARFETVWKAGPPRIEGRLNAVLEASGIDKWLWLVEDHLQAER